MRACELDAEHTNAQAIFCLRTPLLSGCLADKGHVGFDPRHTDRTNQPFRRGYRKPMTMDKEIGQRFDREAL
jgi:hypothetical protein